MDFQITLRAVRISSGYTMKEVAEKLDISIGTLGRYERNSGKMPFDTAAKLLLIYQIPFDAVRFGAESSHRN